VQDPVTKLAERLVASYARSGGINHLDGKNLPSKRAVTDITIDLLRLLFPGFFDGKLIHSSEIKVETAALLDTVLGALEDEIYKSLEYSPPAGIPKKDLRKVANLRTVRQQCEKVSRRRARGEIARGGPGGARAKAAPDD
jgi:serine O-acetyltransferase